MNFLNLCKVVRRECSISGTGPAAVANQTGEMLRVVEWTAQAYEDICSRHTRWDFLRSSFTVNTVSGTAAYAPTAVTNSDTSVAITLAEFSEWLTDTFKLYLTSSGVATEQEIYPTDSWDDFREVWQFGTVTNARPTTFSIRPRDSAIVFGATPDATYTCRGDYMRTAPALAADADEPLFPARFHMAIVWNAVKRYARYQETAGLYQAAGRDFNDVYGRLEIDQLPNMRMGCPLA